MSIVWWIQKFYLKGYKKQSQSPLHLRSVHDIYHSKLNAPIHLLTTDSALALYLAAVGVIAILKRMLKFDCIVLVLQYRPPMKCCTVEFPAGI